MESVRRDLSKASANSSYRLMDIKPAALIHTERGYIRVSVYRSVG